MGSDDEIAQMQAEFDKKELDLKTELAKLEIQKKQAEAERDAAKAAQEQESLNNETLLEQITTINELLSNTKLEPETKPSEKTTDISESSGYIAEIVGYHSLKEISSEITRRLNEIKELQDDSCILIVNHLDYASDDIPLIEVKSKIDLFDKLIKSQIDANNKILDEIKEIIARSGVPEPVSAPEMAIYRPLSFSVVAPLLLAALPVVSGLVGTAADIAGYLKTDYAMKGATFSIKDEALNCAVAGALRSDKRKVYLYNFYSLVEKETKSTIITNFERLDEKIVDLTKTRNSLDYFTSSITEKISELEKDLKKLKSNSLSDPDAREKIQKNIQEINDETEWLARAKVANMDSGTLQKEYTTFINAVNSSGNSDSKSKLMHALFREKINDLGIKYLLFLKVLSSGGESITKKGMLASNKNVNFIGGTVITYALGDINGAVLASDNLVDISSVYFDLKSGTGKPIREILPLHSDGK